MLKRFVDMFKRDALVPLADLSCDGLDGGSDPSIVAKM